MASLINLMSFHCPELHSNGISSVEVFAHCNKCVFDAERSTSFLLKWKTSCAEHANLSASAQPSPFEHSWQSTWRLHRKLIKPLQPEQLMAPFGWIKYGAVAQLNCHLIFHVGVRRRFSPTQTFVLRYEVKNPWQDPPFCYFHVAFWEHQDLIHD